MTDPGDDTVALGRPATELVARWRTESSIQRARVAALLLATGITVSLRGLSADPRWVVPGVLLVTIVATEVGLRSAPRGRLLTAIGWGSFLGDTLAVTTALWIINTNPADPIWAITALLAIEAASRWHTRGALLGGVLGALLAAWWATAAYAAEQRALSVESLVFRGAVIIVLALPVGMLIDRLRREQQRARQLYELSTELIVMVDDDDGVVGANPAAERLVGVGADALIGRTWDALLPGAPGIRELIAASAAGGPTMHEHVGEDGTATWLELTAARAGERGMLHVIGRDVTVRVRTEQQLRASEQRFRALFERNVDAVIGLDVLGCILHANPAAARMLATPVAGMLEQPLLELVPLTDRDAASAGLTAALAGTPDDDPIVLRLGYDRPRDVSLALLPTVVDGEVTGVFAIARDITDERVREEELRFQAHHDQLTGLANRTALHDRLRSSLAADRAFGVLFLDLDGLKRINDSLGHAAGDAALVAVAERLQHTVRESDAAYRLAGDEFCVVIEPADAASLPQLRDRVARVLGEPLAIGDHLVPMSASVGMSMARPDDDADALLHRADEAMYRIKTTRGGRDTADHELPPAETVQ